MATCVSHDSPPPQGPLIISSDPICFQDALHEAGFILDDSTSNYTGSNKLRFKEVFKLYLYKHAVFHIYDFL